MFEWLNRLARLVSSWFEPMSQPEPAPSPPPPLPAPAPAPRPLEPSVVEAINDVRTSFGLSLMEQDDSLAGLATAWARSMSKSWGLSHGDFAGRISSIYPNTFAAENIAEGQPDARAVVDGWMNSPPHRANILGDYNRVGAGSESNYWCADFVLVR